jgi:hypothetical protein
LALAVVSTGSISAAMMSRNAFTARALRLSRLSAKFGVHAAACRGAQRSAARENLQPARPLDGAAIPNKFQKVAAPSAKRPGRNASD